MAPSEIRARVTIHGATWIITCVCGALSSRWLPVDDEWAALIAAMNEPCRDCGQVGHRDVVIESVVPDITVRLIP